MRRYSIFLFGEAEKGEFCSPSLCRDPVELLERFGNPPPQTYGIFYAMQALLYKRELIFFRVLEEGFSVKDYWKGIKILEEKKFKNPPSALCMPGMGDHHILEASLDLCKKDRLTFLVNEQDFYDYLTWK